MVLFRSILGNLWVYSIIGFGTITMSIFGWFIPQSWHVTWWNKILQPCVLWGLRVFNGVSVEIRGKQNIIPKSLYASKHQSAWETYALCTMIEGATMVLKKELTKIPFFGWAQAQYGCIAVDRKAGASAMKNMLKDAKDITKKNRSIIIFPEGHRVKAGTKENYKPGFLFMAQTLKLKVIPVALNSGMYWPRNSFVHTPGKIIVEFLEPMEVGKDKEAFMKEMETKIEQKCAELNAEAMRDYPATIKNYYGKDKLEK